MTAKAQDLGEPWGRFDAHEGEWLAVWDRNGRLRWKGIEERARVCSNALAGCPDPETMIAALRKLGKRSWPHKIMMKYIPELADPAFAWLREDSK